MTRTTEISEPRPFWGAGLEKRRSALLEKSLRPDDRVLDFGCGRGAYVRWLLEHEVPAQGVDVLRYADWEAIEAAFPEAKAFVQTDSGEIPFGDNEFGVACCFEVLEHCNDPLEVLRELKRVTQRELLLSVPDCSEPPILARYSLAFSHWTDQTHVNFFTKESFLELLADAGLVVDWVGGAYKIDIHGCYWEHVGGPRWLRALFRRLAKRFARVPPHFSSILVRSRPRK